MNRDLYRSIRDAVGDDQQAITPLPPGLRARVIGETLRRADERRGHPSRRLLASAAIAVGLAAIVSGTLLYLGQGQHRTPSPAGAPPSLPPGSSPTPAITPTAAAAPTPGPDTLVVPALGIEVRMSLSSSCAGLLQEVPAPDAVEYAGLPCSNILAGSESPLANLTSVASQTQLIVYDHAGVRHTATFGPPNVAGPLRRNPDGSWPGFGYEAGTPPSFLIFVRSATTERYIFARITS